jgi:hypothetical protein
MEGKRASGSSASPRITVRRTHAGTFTSLGGSWMGDSGPRASARAFAVAGGRETAEDGGSRAALDISSGSKGRVPKSARYSDAQKLNWSERASTPSPRYCSGDMKAGVPMTSPSCVSGEDSDGASGDAPGRESSPTASRPRARPKSVTQTRPSLPTSTLAGLKSRCTSPAACAASSPRPAARYLSSTSRQERGFSCIQSRRVPPSSSSIVTNTWPSQVPTSKTGMTLGWEMRAMACASRNSRACPGSMAA